MKPQQATADFFAVTRDLLLQATEERSAKLLTRAAIRLNEDPRYDALPAEQQQELDALYAQALLACGAFTP